MVAENEKHNAKRFHALVLAGGIGVRLWPKSRQNRPKQFLSIDGEHSLLGMTIERIAGLFPKENIWIICKKQQYDQVLAALPDFPTENLIIEPSPKGTCAAIVYGCLLIEDRQPNAVVTVFPSDHIIRPQDRFMEFMEAGLSWAQSHDCLVVYGIQPDSPETSYGYIEMGATAGHVLGLTCNEVRRFHEKPDRRTATAYFQSKRFLWNSGMFSIRPVTLFSLLGQKQFSLWHPLLEAFDGNGDMKGYDIQALYANLPDDAFDTAIVEKMIECRNVMSMKQVPDLVVFPCDFTWYDMGVWSSYFKYFHSDGSGNTLVGNAVVLDCNGCLMVSDQGGLVAAIGVDDIVVVHQGDVVLVCHKRQIDRIRELVNILKEKGLEEFA